MKKSNEIDMVNGPILSKILIFAIPLMFSSILQLMFNAADIVVVGRFGGDNALGAVGATSPVINLLTNLLMGLSVGANVCVSNFIGAKNSKNVVKTVHTSMCLSLLGGLTMALIGITFAGPILRAMNAPEKTIYLSKIYLMIYCAGMPGAMVYNFGAAILRAVGDTKRPLNYLLISGVINVILNLIFVIVLNMSVAGVATATVISQFVSALLVVRALRREEGDLKLILSKVKLDKDIVIKIFKIGLPAGLQGALFSLSNIVIQSSINSFGPEVVDGNSAAQNIEGFIYMSMNAFYQAAISFTSQNMGAGKIKRIGRIAIASLASVATVGAVLGNLAFIFGRNLLSIYTNKPDVIEYGLTRLGVICTIYFLCGIMDVMVGVLRGMGYSVGPMVVTLIGVCGLRLLWIFTVFKMPRFHTPKIVYMTYPITWTLTFFVLVIMYVHVKGRLKGIKKSLN